MSSFISNKRGNADVRDITANWWYYIIVLLLVSFTFLIFLSSAISLADKRSDPYAALELDIFTSQLVNVCFSYVEDAGTPMEKYKQNIIDSRKLTLEQLERCTTKGTYIEVTNLEDPQNFYELKRSTTTPDQKETRYTLLKVDDKIVPAKIEVRIT